ncbi:hypothetical protein CHU92_02300 [Flavobacterium cyanobacteriorum]|uniref:Peptidase E n=1 Tax=Flavobacterium cyanobacteriorum TaxID=2022802 RepID=A0A255ZVP4_9FLAO|nr:DUF6702 family protein [Flavobacterium cyanobacteriorum]OYQ44830.1 hypothetical protein CHU92_02300 [Flavobacterium cyanobacteriorum]
MKAGLKHITVILICLGLTSAAAHKFYVAVFQLEYRPEKKVVQMTARIFVDDMEAALKKQFGKTFYIGQKHEVAGADEYLKKYLAGKIRVRLNGIAKPLNYLGKELEDDVLVCYYTLPAENPIKSIEVKNTTLFELFPDQQNIIHTNINRNKKSLLLTNDTEQGILDY